MVENAWYNATQYYVHDGAVEIRRADTLRFVRPTCLFEHSIPWRYIYGLCADKPREDNRIRAVVFMWKNKRAGNSQPYKF
jgi:hypothetical protein